MNARYQEGQPTVFGMVQPRKARIVKPGAGTLAALRHICPHCAAAQGVRCTMPSGEPRHYVHSKRMDLARASAAGVLGPVAVAWRYPIGGGRFAATVDEDDAYRASTDGAVEALGVIPAGVNLPDGAQQ